MNLFQFHTEFHLQYYFQDAMCFNFQAAIYIISYCIASIFLCSASTSLTTLSLQNVQGKVTKITLQELSLQYLIHTWNTTGLALTYIVN